jgi:hypothetical protein
MPRTSTRRFLATFLATASGFTFLFALQDFFHPAGVLALLSIAGGLALHAQSTGAQIVARGAIWSSATFQLLLVHLMSFDAPFHDFRLLLVVTPGCVIFSCMALHMAGRPDRLRSSNFQPVAHRGTLTAALILAVADAVSLLLWGSMAAKGGATDTAIFLLGCAALMGVGVYGLIRMRTWALLLNLVSNILIASVATSNLVEVGPLALVLITTAGLQLLVALPIFVSILRPDLRAPSWMQAVGRGVPAASLVGIALLGLQPLLSESILIRIAYWAGY